MVHGRTRRVRQKKRRQTGAAVDVDEGITINVDEAFDLAATAAISGLVSAIVARKVGGDGY